MRMALFGFCHTQKNSFALFIVLPIREITVSLRGFNFGLPVAPCGVDRPLMIVGLGGHTALKRKERRFPIAANPKSARAWRADIDALPGALIGGLDRGAQGRLSAGCQLLCRDDERH